VDNDRLVLLNPLYQIESAGPGEPCLGGAS
jgi:hypothetical protein